MAQNGNYYYSEDYISETPGSRIEMRLMWLKYFFLTRDVRESYICWAICVCVFCIRYNIIESSVSKPQLELGAPNIIFGFVYTYIKILCISHFNTVLWWNVTFPYIHTYRVYYTTNIVLRAELCCDMGEMRKNSECIMRWNVLYYVCLVGWIGWVGIQLHICGVQPHTHAF